MQKLDIDEASFQQLQDGGLKMQVESKKALERMGKKLGEAEDIGTNTALEITK